MILVGGNWKSENKDKTIVNSGTNYLIESQTDVRAFTGWYSKMLDIWDIINTSEKDHWKHLIQKLM